MGARFSLIYPTRHRPAFIKQALRFLEKQEYRDFEVIISDNYVDPALSCEDECRNTSLTNLRYFHPLKPLGMVQSWNYALQFASGDYICYFTDKMFLLPHTLSVANDCVEKFPSDIVSWVDNIYSPINFPDYFGKGRYIKSVHSEATRSDFAIYDPYEELSKKGCAYVPRGEQDRSTYVRGKICFGAYSSELCDRIINKTGNLFHNISPDYTSMILGLSMAKSAVEIDRPGIVHVNTDLSNGGQVAIRDEFALKYLSDLGNKEKILDNFLIPGLYSSSHNVVVHDYLTLKKKYGLDFEFDTVNWLVYITEDLDAKGRQWSSKEVENQQRGLLQGFIDSLSNDDRIKYEKRLSDRRMKKKKREHAKSRAQYLRKSIKSMLPVIVAKILMAWTRQPKPNHYDSIEDILN